MKKSIYVFIMVVLVATGCMAAGGPSVFAVAKVGKVIVIDPGHGGIDGGTQSAQGDYLEKNLNLEVSRKLKQALEDKGFTVYLTREEDTDVTQHAPNSAVKSRHRRDLMGRVEFAKQHQANLVISIHTNTGTKTNIGPLVICQPESYESVTAAEIVQHQFNSMTGIGQHVIKGKRLYILTHSTIPVILVEVGFLSNPRDAYQLHTPQYQQKLIEAIVSGVNEYFVTKVS
ncbi:MAG: hypothetical protein JWN30_2652 [Bacilli bacterium]|nr:hypothetical protein [Bacilli bacterium]